jgi:hypothetical protein
MVGAWGALEPGLLRRPWPVQLLLALMAFAFLTGNVGDCLAFGLGFHCLLRPGEICALKPNLIALPGTFQMCQVKVGVVSIERPKTRKTGGRQQHVLVDDKLLMDCLRRYLSFQVPDSLIFSSYSTLRAHLSYYLSALGLPTRLVTLGGMRGGGATYHYLLYHDVPTLQRRGRWANIRSLEHYVQEAAVVLGASSWVVGSAGPLLEKLSSLAPLLLARYAAGAAVV